MDQLPIVNAMNEEIIKDMQYTEIKARERINFAKKQENEIVKKILKYYDRGFIKIYNLIIEHSNRLQDNGYVIQQLYSYPSKDLVVSAIIWDLGKFELYLSKI